MPKLIYTVGLPASGKSTYAREQAANSNGEILEVSKDDLRVLPEAPQGRKREKWVVAKRDEVISKALQAGKSIIVHDTNFNPVHARRFAELADTHGAELERIEFTTDVLECIARDAKRQAHVGADVIMGMWQQYCYQPPATTPSANLPRAVLVDIDGTLARANDRSPYAWDRVGEDQPVLHIVELVHDLAASGTTPVYMSGRDEICREQTQAWLDTHVQIPGPLFMRARGDSRKDAIVKAELYRTHVENNYKVRFVLDDRNTVVHMWRTEIGLPVLQVEYGYF